MSDVIERRTVESLNIQLRVFDALKSDRMTSLDDLEKILPFGRSTIIKALERLRAVRALRPASCIDGVWMYAKKPDAERPVDRRGKR